MARKGLFQPDQVADQTIQRNFALVKVAIETLARDHDVVAAPVTTIVATGPIPPGVMIVSFTGGIGQTLTLPPANAIGPNIGSFIALLTGNSCAVVPSRGDTVNGATSLSVGAVALCLFVSDGVSKWLGNV